MATLQFPHADVTRLLSELRAGDRSALDRLFEAIYPELRRLAHAQIARLPQGGMLCTTALVHEAYLKFSRAGEISASDRTHFHSLAARAMRQILVDQARRRLAARAGGAREARPLEEGDHAVAVDLARVLTIDAALARLAALEPRLAELVEWRVFAGLTLEEIALTREVSVTTLKREWRRARAFLYRELGAAGL